MTGPDRHARVLRHEASHLAMCEILGITASGVHIEVRDGLAVGGHVNHLQAPTTDRERLIDLAGIAGEVIGFGTIGWPQPDLDAVNKLGLRDVRQLIDRAIELLRPQAAVIQRHVDRIQEKLSAYQGEPGLPIEREA